MYTSLTTYRETAYWIAPIALYVAAVATFANHTVQTPEPTPERSTEPKLTTYQPLPMVKAPADFEPAVIPVPKMPIKKAPAGPSTEPNHQIVEARVTGYNTTPGQTSGNPCIAASGANICGRRDVVACPRRIPLGTEVHIAGKQYVCEDRLHSRYDSRFDISCDKDMRCPYQVTGTYRVRVIQ